MKVLVTGGAGYIGSHCCVSLLENGHDVVVADSLVNSHSEVLERLKKLTGKTIPFYQVDIRDREGLQQVFSAHSFDAVIHFAGLKAVGESTKEPLLYYRNNLDATLSLLECMEEFSVRRLVFSSSATVYSPNQPMPLNEDAATGNCSNPYGWTKYICEQILRDLCRAKPAWSVCLLRYFNPVGAHESGCIGEDPNGIPNNLMPFVCQTAAGRREQLSVFGKDYPTPDGTGVRDYIHVVDLAKGHVNALDYLFKQNGLSVFNLGTGRPYSVLELVESFERVNGVKVPHTFAPRREGDVAVCYADPEKSCQELNWRAERDLETMCKDAWNFQRKNPMGYES